MDLLWQICGGLVGLAIGVVIAFCIERRRDKMFAARSEARREADARPWRSLH